MKFSIGDKILLKRSGEEGSVVRVINKEMVEVEVAGTLFPVYLDDIEHPYLKWFTAKTPQKQQKPSHAEFRTEKPAERKQRLATGVYLSFVPVFRTVDMEERVDFLKVWLLNELGVDISFDYDARVDQLSLFSLKGSLHSFGNLYLHNLDFEAMNDQPRFHWQISSGSGTKATEANGTLRIKPVKLFEHINEILSGKDSSFSYLLAKDLTPLAVQKKVDDLLPPPPETVAARRARVATVAPGLEVDLHIEQLIGNTRGLTNSDIIDIQLRALQRALDTAMSHRQELLIVIHGLGKGTLREEVHKVLKQTKEVGRFKNEWSGKYGFGATEVWFRY